MSQPQLPASHRYKRWLRTLWRVLPSSKLSLNVHISTENTDGTCSKWSERLHQDKKSGESRYKEDTAGGNATLATFCLHPTIWMTLCTVCRTRDPSRTASQCCWWAPIWSHSPYIYAPWEARWTQRLVPSETVWKHWHSCKVLVLSHSVSSVRRQVLSKTLSKHYWSIKWVLNNAQFLKHLVIQSGMSRGAEN